MKEVTGSRIMIAIHDAVGGCVGKFNMELSRRDNCIWNKNNSHNLKQDLSNYFHYITKIFVKRESK